MEQEFSSVHEQNVTKGLVLSEKAEVCALIPMTGLIFLVGLGFPFMVIFHPSISMRMMILAIAFTAIAVSAIPAIHAFKVLSTFTKENKRADKDGQKWLREQSFANKLVLNNNSPIVERIYGKK